MNMNDLRKEMVKTKSKLDDLVEKNISLDPSYVNHRLEECNELVQYYSIMCTKQQMDDSNVELNEWWELAKFKEEMQRNLIAHIKDEDAYRRHLYAFKKTFLDDIYHNPNNSEPSSQRWRKLNAVEQPRINKQNNYKIEGRRPRYSNYGSQGASTKSYTIGDNNKY